MSAPWSSVLATVAELLNGGGVEWMLLGSAATALRGAAVVPGDLDIAAASVADVVRAAEVLPTPASRRGQAPDEWISTTGEPALEFGGGGERWTFGRWYVEGVKVEIAHVDAPAVAGLMVETRSARVWEVQETLDCRGQPVPAVPVELQLATMVARRQHTRIEATLAAVDRLDRLLLRRAISDRRAEGVAMAVPAELERFL